MTGNADRGGGHIVVGVNGTAAAAAAVRWAILEARLRQSSVHLVLACDHGWRSRAPYAGRSGAPGPDEDNAAGTVLFAAEQQVSQVLPPGRLSSERVDGSAARVLIDRSAGAEGTVKRGTKRHRWSGVRDGAGDEVGGAVAEFAVGGLGEPDEQFEGLLGGAVLLGDEDALGARTPLTGLRKDGTTFPVQVSLAPLATAAGRFTIAVVRDLTGTREAGDPAGIDRAAAAAQEHRGQELLDRIVHNLFGIALSLQATIHEPGEVARPRITGALQDSTTPSARSATIYSPSAVKPRPRQRRRTATGDAAHARVTRTAATRGKRVR